MRRTSRVWPLLALWLVACSKAPPDHLDGYVETEAVRLASPVAGRLLQRAAQGQQLQAGEQAYRLAPENDSAALSAAQAQTRQAEAQARDLQTGKRPAELAVYDAAERAARASLQASETELQRQTALQQAGFASESLLSSLRARRDADAAQVQQVVAQRAAAELAGRAQALQAAAAGVDVAKALQAQQDWRLDQKNVEAPVAGRVEQVYFQVGEWVPAGTPVLSVLPAQALKLRFYIPEPWLTRLPVGKTVTVRCDGCAAGLQAQISYVAREAEFTPPVLYSQDNRARLLFMAEARPLPAQAAQWRAGQPVQVVLP